LAHHRFVWIHPFDNWNWRTVRLFTYAMLKIAFWVNVWWILNPTAIFCNNRNKYYDNLSLADSWNEEDLINWCEYVLEWLKTEIEKIDKFLDYTYLSKNILIPTIELALDREYITEKEFNILKISIKNQILEPKDLEKIFVWTSPQERSRIIKRLKDKKMLQSEKQWSRKYIINFSNNYLLRSFIEILWKGWFLPDNNENF
jgi:Fic family protein